MVELSGGNLKGPKCMGKDLVPVELVVKDESREKCVACLESPKALICPSGTNLSG